MRGAFRAANVAGVNLVLLTNKEERKCDFLLDDAPLCSVRTSTADFPNFTTHGQGAGSVLRLISRRKYSSSRLGLAFLCGPPTLHRHAQSCAPAPVSGVASTIRLFRYSKGRSTDGAASAAERRLRLTPIWTPSGLLSMRRTKVIMIALIFSGAWGSSSSAI